MKIPTTETLIRVLTELDAASARYERPLTLIVLDAYGREMFVRRGIGTAAFTIAVATAKARTALAFGMTSAEFSALNDRVPELPRVASASLDFVPTTLGGGVPVRREGEIIGAVAVGGATQEQDAEIAEVIGAILAA